MFNGFLRPVPSGVRNIKSIQRGSFSYYNLTTYNVTINPVDTTKSIIYVSHNGGYARANTDLIAAKISNSTTINFSSGDDYTNEVIVSWIVIEFTNVKSLQTGSVVASGATTNVAISTVDILKSFSVVSKKSTSTSSTTGYYRFTHHITTATNLAITGQNVNTETYEWQVIEFY